MSISVKTPATSANLGCGTDCLGVALPLYMTATFEFSQKNETRYADGTPTGEVEKNLIYIAARKILRMAGQEHRCLTITEQTDVPRSRGMGSSACAIVAGVCGANALLDNQFTTEQLICAAAEIEGHPDNVVPCMVGGFTVAMANGPEVHYTKMPVDARLSFVAAVPDFHLSTSEARAVLPKEVSLHDALAQLQRACYFVSALSAGNFDGLRPATEDLLFTPARGALIPGLSEVRQGALESGAVCATISGAGPTVLAISTEEGTNEAIAMAMREGFRSAGIESVTHILKADNTGVVITRK